MTGPRAVAPPVVCVGASAGGLPALEALVAQVPTDTPAAWVVIQHFAPDQPSILHELLQTRTDVSVAQVGDGEPVEPGRIVVAPPGALATVEAGRYRLEPRPASPLISRPIDHFLFSLAASRAADAVCVILSGTGSDGSEGLKTIKASGGFAFAQDRSGARFPGMPESAVATGLVDAVLRAEDIPARVTDILAHRAALMEGAEARRAAIRGLLARLTRRLAEVSGNDFSAYKPGTLVRRIERRMALMRLSTPERFVEVIERDDEQARALAQEFLIGVTQFFRDPDAFEALRERVVAPLVESARSNVRVWSAGCATGEEAYSLAILFREEMERQGRHVALQVFGTDIDAPALAAARGGRFPAAAVEALSPERRERWFAAEGSGHRAVQPLREMCVFAPHNIVRDPPFSRLDLVSCRNLLIYLSAELQALIMPRLHFALRGRGHLFLGPSEGVSGAERLFHAVDPTHRIFRRDPDARAPYSPLADPLPRPRPPERPPAGAAPPSRMQGEVAREMLAEREFLRRHAAPFALVTAEGEILYQSQRMAEFVRPAPGTPSTMLDVYLVRDLRLPVRDALERAARAGAPATAEAVAVTADGGTDYYDVAVTPVPAEPGRFLLSLAPVRALDPGPLADALDRRQDADQDRLEAETFDLRRRLAAALGEFEASGQELRSTNEELLTMNEELQSSNEELETSREELQSFNEELETVNAELHENNRALTRANSDLKNLFDSTDVAVLFLDRHLCVRGFTPTVPALFGLRGRDVGRPLSDLSSRIDMDALRLDAEAVERDLRLVEREVTVPAASDAPASTYLLRVRPYRTTENLIDGYVVSFVDITRRKADEERLRRSEATLARQYAELENLYAAIPVGLALIDRRHRYLRINERLAAINGRSVADTLGRTGAEVVPEIAPQVAAVIDRVFATGEAVLGVAVSGLTPGTDAARDYVVDHYPVYLDGKVIAVGTCVLDVTEEARLRRELADSLERVRESEARLARMFDAAPALACLHEGPEHRYVYTNPAHDEVLGGRDLVGLSIAEAVPEVVGQGVIERFDEVYRTGRPMQTPDVDVVLDGRDGPARRVFSQHLQPWRGPDGAVAGVMSFAFDVTEQRRAAEQKTMLLAELQHRVKNTLATISAISRMLLRDGDTAEGYRERLAQRLRSIARTHDLLTDGEWGALPLSAVLRAELRPYERGSADVLAFEGDDVALGPRQSLALGMAFHELATNAAKYGALSVEGGTVRVRSDAVRDKHGRALRRITWDEVGGPPIEAPPARRGFGSVVLDSVLARDMAGAATSEFRREGLRFELIYPEAEHDEETEGPSGGGRELHRAGPGARPADQGL